MLNDSNSPQSDYSSLCSWLNHPETQEVLSLLQTEANDLKEITINHVPRRDIGAFFGDLVHREQSLGEIRGLQRLQKVLFNRRDELEIRLGLKQEPLQPPQESNV